MYLVHQDPGPDPKSDQDSWRNPDCQDKLAQRAANGVPDFSPEDAAALFDKVKDAYWRATRQIGVD